MALTDSLIEYWAFDEASGDRTGEHNSLVLTDNNTVASATGLVYSLAADFEADNNEYLSRSDDSNMSTGDIDFTFAVWFKAETTTQNRSILVKGNASSYEYRISKNASAQMQFAVCTNLFETGLTTLTESSFGAIDTDWHFLVCWHDATGASSTGANTIAIVIDDGTVDSTSHSGGSFDSSLDFEVGRWAAQPDEWDGLLGPLMFWKRCLTSAEITQLYNSGAGLTYAAFTGGAAVALDPMGVSGFFGLEA